MLHLSNRIANGICLLFLSLFIAQPGQAADLIRINGSGSGLDMMKPLIAAYTKTHPEVDFGLDKPLGSSGAIKALKAGMLDLAMTSRPLKPEETAAGIILLKYGQTPLAIVTNKDVGKKDINSQELVNFYAGKTANWPDGKPVRLILRPKEDADTKVIRKFSPEMDVAMTSAQAKPGMIVAITDPEAAESIAKTSGALGAAGLTGVIVGQLPLKVMSVNGVEPTPETLANGTYPFAKQLDIVTMGSTLPEPAKKFLTFVYSLEGRGIAHSAGVQITAGEESAKWLK